MKPEAVVKAVPFICCHQADHNRFTVHHIFLNVIQHSADQFCPNMIPLIVRMHNDIRNKICISTITDNTCHSYRTFSIHRNTQIKRVLQCNRCTFFCDLYPVNCRTQCIIIFYRDIILFSVYSCLQCIAIIIFSQDPKYIVYFTLRMHTMRIVIVSA